MNYTEPNFTYVQIGAHGSFSVYENDSIPYIRDHFSLDWNVIITEPDFTKFQYLQNTFAGISNVRMLNVGIHEDTSAKHYSISFLPVVEEIEAESGLFEEMTYDLYIGPKYEGNFATLPEANSMKAQILEKFYDVPWITQVASYNFSSVLAPSHLNALSELADYVTETENLTTWSSQQLIENMKLSKIDILQLAQSGDDYEILKSFPFESIDIRNLTFKTSHMSSVQSAEINTLLNAKGFNRDDRWILDFSHVGYTKNAD